MSLSAWRLTAPFDPGRVALSFELYDIVDQAAATAPVVLLVAGAHARRSGWAGRAAVALARAWSRAAPGVVLADLTIGDAELSELAGVSNDEGLADVFLFGASISHVRHPVADQPFSMISAGVAPAEIETVLRHPRWQSVVAEFFRTAEALLVYVPAEAPGLDELARRIGCGMALVAPGDDDALAAAFPEEFAVLTTLAAPADQLPPDLALEPEPATAEELTHPEPAPGQESADVPEPAAPALRDEPPAPEQTAPETAEPEPAQPEAARPEAAQPEAAQPEPAQPEPAAAHGTVEPVETAAADEAAPPSAESSAPSPAVEPEVPPPPPPPPPSPEVEGVDAPAEADAAKGARTVAADWRDPRDALVDALWARRSGGAQAAREASSVKPDPVPGRAVTEEELLNEPPALEREPRGRRRGVSLLLWLALGAAVALGIVFGAQEYFGYDVFGVFGGGAAAAPSDAPAARAAPPPHAMATPLPFSVAIEARESYASALERLAELQKAEPALHFFVSPVRIGGVLYYRIMAGPVVDSAAAAVLMQRLLEAGVKTGTSQWDIRPTRWSFLLGDFAARDAAVARADSLGKENIPTYIVGVPYSAGPPHWRLYGGAFEGRAQADVLRPLLRGAGVPDTLVERTGTVQ